ncbi:H/ACA ribonucleoprotein complex subunit GAR1 [Methanoregula sp.]|uniref:H/ACA ribonucleoprotein complex subunit GAR1 n=1 Tax=Methanoregula sp. TaxID=2052170 RepID=UPI0025DDB4FC|nr:RNA-binding protein [Methanoregula sp.]
MKVVGRAMSTYGSRMFIIQCDAAQLPGLYSEVMDRRTKPVGKIMDVFGNVKSPYALVLTHGPCGVTAGEKVFARETRTPAITRSESIRTTVR